MKHFLVKGIVFIFILLSYFGINSVINIWFYKNQPLNIANKEILIAGDSGPQRSLNPKYFKSAQNISQSAEPYVLTYWKLKKIFQNYNPNILLLGFTPHNISAYNDFKFTNTYWSHEMFKRSYTIQYFNNIDEIISVDYSTFYKTVFRQLAYYPKRNHVNYIGNYNSSKSSNVSDWKSAIKRHYFLNNQELGASAVAISYLDSITRLCDSKNITLVLVRNPVHKDYLDNIPQSIMNVFSFLENKYKGKYLVIDKSSELFPDSLFLNSNHLNKYGAEKFTKQIIDELNKAKAHNTLPKYGR